MWLRYYGSMFTPPPRVTTSTPNPDVVGIPILPHVVELDHLYENGKLLDDTTINEILSKHLTEGHHTKSESQTPYNIFVSGDDTYAIYLGKKHNKNLGEGAFSIVKVAQNLKTGEWICVKLHEQHAKSGSIKTEVEMLNESDLRIDGKPIDLYTRLSTKMMDDPRALTNTVREFLTQFKPGILLRYIVSDKTLPKALKIDIAILLIERLQALHKKGIEHNDVHTGNAIYDPAKHTLSLIDYGKSKRTPKITSEADDFKKILNILEKIFGEHTKAELAGLAQHKNPLMNMINFLKDARDNLSKEESTMKVGVIDLNHYDENYIKEHIQDFKQANLIVFVDSGSEPNIKRYLSCQQLLTNNRILVGRTVLTKNAPEALSDKDKFLAITPPYVAKQSYHLMDIAASTIIAEHDFTEDKTHSNRNAKNRS